MKPNVRIFGGVLAVDLSAVRLVSIMPQEREVMPGHVIGALIIFHDSTHHFVSKADGLVLLDALAQAGATGANPEAAAAAGAGQ